MFVVKYINNQKYKKIKDLKTSNRDHKKAIKQRSGYYAVDSMKCIIHMAGDTTNVTFNHLTYEY